MDLRMKGFQTNKQSIYIDCKQLLRRLYRLRFKVAKRHRGYLFDSLLVTTLLSMSTLGIFANKTMRKTVSALCDIIGKRVGKFLERNPKKNTFLIREKFKTNTLRRAA